MKATLVALVFGGIAMTAGTAVAGAMPVPALHTVAPGGVVQVQQPPQDGKQRTVRNQQPPQQRAASSPPPRAPYIDYNATYRGFEDPGFALRGNMPGCAIDLGYGRWETCD